MISANVYASAYTSVILVNSQMCQSWCHKILVTATEIARGEGVFYKFIMVSVLQSSTELARARDM